MVRTRTNYRRAGQSRRGPDEARKTTLIEALINQELGEPFRRDAMKKPVAVAGISRDDMRPQKGRLTRGMNVGPTATRCPPGDGP